MTEAASEIAQTIGAHGLEGVGALGLYWVAGPSLRNVGRAFGDWTDWRMRNLLRLGEKVQARRDPLAGTEDDEARVHPKVLHEIVERGSWTDDEVAQEYLAGLLVTSRTPEGRDEYGAYLASIVAGLTSAQIRLHHAIYSALNGAGAPIGDGLATRASAARHNVFVPWRELRPILNVEPSVDTFIAARGSIHGLAREGLVDHEFGLSDTRAGFMASYFPSDPSANAGGLLATPTALGVEIFARAHGIVTRVHNDLLIGLDLPDLGADMPRSAGALVGQGRLP